MFPEKTYEWGVSRSCIRELAEYGAIRKKEIGTENVFDFSLGNPSIPSPDIIDETIIDIVSDSSIPAHAYTTAAGILPLREKICAELKERFSIETSSSLIYVTCGAAASLTISLKAILFEGDEVIVSAPFFPEYTVFTESMGGVLRVIEPRKDFMIDVDGLRAAINEKTRALIINSPNNPSGAVYSQENLMETASVLKEAEERYSHPIFIISDEPYRELVYDGRRSHSPIEYYDDTIMCYSWSKSLSLPGERIGYIAINGRCKVAGDLYSSIMGAGRSLGFVNPPSLFQRVMERCIGNCVDKKLYEENRDILMKGLDQIGYEFVRPEGAFYLFMKALEDDAKTFSERAKQHELLLVPSDDFGMKGYVRIAYCVSKEMIEESLKAFEDLYKEYK